MSRRDEVLVRLQGPDGPLKARAALRALTNALHALDHVHRDVGRVVWVIASMSTNSPLVATFVPADATMSDAGMEKVNRLFKGIAGFRERDRLPDGWDVETARAVIALAKESLNGAGPIVLSSPLYGDVQPRADIADNIQAAIRRVTTIREEWTTLEGTLDDILAHGSLQFRVYDTSTGDPIRCIFADNEDIEKVKSSLQKRVMLYGRARFTGGRPKEIRVQRFSAFPDVLPKAADLKPMDLTGGLDSVEFVRRGRDDEED